MSAISGKWTGRVTEQISDESGLGRWSGFKLRCKGERHFYVITAYRPPIDYVSSTGFQTAFMQQWRLLRGKDIDNPDPRSQMLTDLTKFIQSVRNAGDELLLMWDANEPSTNCSSAFSQFISDTGLISLMGPRAHSPTTYARGTKCIDYMSGTPGVYFSVLQSGYLPFYEGAFHSDHRALFVDLDDEALFGAITSSLPAHTARFVTGTNKKTVEKYIQKIELQLQVQQMEEELSELESNKKWQTPEHNKLEQIDNQLTGGMRQSEKHCERPDTAPWNPKMSDAYLVYSYWKKELSFLKTKQSRTEQQEAIKQRLDDDKLYMGDPNRKPSAQLRRASKLLKLARRQAVDDRQLHLHIRYELLVLEGKMTAAAAVKAIEKSERTNRCFRLFKAMLKPPRTSGGISHVLKTKPDGTRERIQERNQLEEVLHKRNEAHFAQADGTPFTRAPLSDLLGFGGNTPFAEEILQGNELPETIPEAVRWILDEIKQVQPAIDSHIPFKDMIRGYRKWKELTTTSPSGRHLGHYKALIASMDMHKPSNTELGEPPAISIAERILRIHNRILNLAISKRHTLQRWRIVHNFFIEKLPGLPLLEKLRVIHLYEADWNLILKYFIPLRLMRESLKNNTLTEEQGGGRPGRSAIDMAVKTVIAFEFCRLQRLLAGKIFNDAAACFDRIMESLSNLTCRKEGLPKEVAELHAQTLELMEYFIKHQGGIGKKPNQHNNPLPFFGPGQGAGDSPGRWGYISDAIIRAYNKRSHKATFIGPLSLRELSESVQAFVDDSSLFLIIPDENGQSIEEYLVHNTQIWERLLNATGGKLQISKCKFTVIQWDYDARGKPTLQVRDPEHHITIMESETNKPVTVDYIKPDEAYKLLGVQIAMSGDTTQQEAVFKTKCEEMACVFSQCPLSPADAIQGYNSVFLPSIKYPLPATNIAWNTLESMQSQVTNNILPKLGYNRNFPRAITYAPEHFGGIGIQHIAVEQGLAHVTMTVSHIRAATTLGEALLILLEAYQNASGFLRSVLHDTRPISYVDSPWITTLREFLHMTSATITIPQLPTTPQLRDHDQSIMEAAIKHQMTPGELNDIDKCRLHLQVTTFAEISASNGKSILDEGFSATTDDDNNPLLWKISGSLIIWPKQPRPDDRSWATWRRFLKNELCDGSRQLRQPLGKWHATCKQYRTWTTYLSTTNTIFHKNPEDRNWLVLEPIRNTRRSTTFELTNKCVTSVPSRACPIAIRHSTNTESMTVDLPQWSMRSNETETTSEPKTLFEFLQSGPTWTRSLVSKINQCTEHAAEALIGAKTIHLGSDGGLDYDHLTFGWVIATDSQILWQGYGVVPPAQRTSTLRAETYGGLIVNYILTAIRQYFHMPQQKTAVHFWTDNFSLKQRIQHYIQYPKRRPTECLAPEYEAILAIIPFTRTHFYYRVHHVKGHQKGDNLSWEAQLNNKCDELATLARSLTIPLFAHNLPSSIATIHINQQEVTSSIATAFRHAATTQDLRAYLQKKYKWTAAAIDSIDWIITSRAFKRIYGRAKITIKKFIHEWLPLNGHPGQTNQGGALLCPCCKTTVEDHQHFTQCPHPSMQPAWTNATQSVQHSLTSSQSDPVLKKLIMCAFSNWRNTQQPEIPQWLPEHYIPLFASQSLIGWNQLIKGRWSSWWVRLHDEHAKRNKIRQNGETWASTTLRQIWENLYDVWKQRCNLQHGDTQQSKRQATQKRLEPRVRAMYGLRERLDHQDRAVLSRPIHEILALHPSSLEKWVFRTEQFIRAGVARAKRRDKQNIRSITQFFEPTGPQTHLSVATLTTSPPPKPPATCNSLRQSTISINNDTMTSQSTHRSLAPPPPPQSRRRVKKKKTTLPKTATRSIATYFHPRPQPPPPPRPPPPDDSTSSTRKNNLRPP